MSSTPIIASNDFDLAVQFGSEPVIMELGLSANGKVPQMHIRASIQEEWRPDYIDWNGLDDETRYLNYTTHSDLAPIIEQLRALVAFYDATVKKAKSNA
jgi:hypothetical protein